MSSVITGYPVSVAYPSTVGGTGTAAKYFPYIPGASIGAVRTTPSATNGIGQLKIPGNSRLDGQAFSVDVVGSIIVDPAIACPAVTVILAAQTNYQIDGHNPLYTTIASTGSQTTNDALGSGEPFLIHIDASFDSRTGVLHGRQNVVFSNVIVADNIVLTNQINGLSPAADVPFGLVVSVTFGTSGANNAAYLNQFQLSA